MTKQELLKMCIKEIFVYWSESNIVNDLLGHKYFYIDKAVDLEKFIEVCKKASIGFEGGGYDKTRFKVVFQDGSEMDHLRIDIDKECSDPLEVVAYYIK